MSLVTRCPSCGTTFRVLPAQLSSRGGRVRCGKCSAVFDGVQSLLTEEAVAALPDEPSPQMALFELRDGAVASNGQEEEDPRPVPGEFADPPPPPEEAAPSPEPPEPPATADLTVPSLQGKPVVPAFLASEHPRAAYTLVWMLLSIIAMGALAVQGALRFRTELGVLLPATRPYLQAGCEFLGCELTLPRRADLMSIESSDLQADNQRPGVIVLNALLRNRAPFAQEFPDLELTLTDQGDRPVIRRVLAPADYLQAKRQTTSPGMGGGAEETVRIYLETGGIVATGYQLFLFYPCPRPSNSAFWQFSYPSRCQQSRAQ